jgi:transcriptional regulator with XRE-family HTH domain
MRLTELRKEKKISQKEFSLIFNVAQNTVSQWETGKRSIDTETLKKIADYFMVTTDYLLGLDEIKSRPSHLEISEDDITLLHKIKNLSPDKREIVDTVIKVNNSNKK